MKRRCTCTAFATCGSCEAAIARAEAARSDRDYEDRTDVAGRDADWHAPRGPYYPAGL